MRTYTICLQNCVYITIHTLLYIYIYIHTCIYAYVYTHTCVCGGLECRVYLELKVKRGREKGSYKDFPLNPLALNPNPQTLNPKPLNP